MWNEILSSFTAYQGSGFVMVLYFMALAYLLLAEKDREKRILFLYVPLTVLALFFLPPVAKLLSRMGEEAISYRMLWLLPVTATLSYAGVFLVHSAPGKLKAPAVIVLGAVFVLAGSLIYRSPYFHKAENIYHVPDPIIGIIEEVEYPGREVMVAFPTDLVPFVRQYTSVVWMPFGREIYMPYAEESHREFADVMNTDPIPAEKLAQYGDAFGCHYIVLSADRAMDGDLTQYGYEFFTERDGYVIYKSLSADFFDPYTVPGWGGR